MNRTQARATAMKLIYEWEMGGDGGEDTLEGILEVKPGGAEYDYMHKIVDGVIGDSAALDQHIGEFSQGWKVDRLSRVDLAILRVAAYELARGDEPVAAIINEAIELSRIYSSDKAGAFINGVLGSMSRAKNP